VLSELATAVKFATLLLKTNPDCATFIGVGTTASGASIAAAQVLADLFAGNTYGSIGVGILPQSPGTIVSANEQGLTIASGGTTQQGAIITLNTAAGTYVNGNIFSQTVTLLHELGHAMNSIFGNGTSGVLNDGSGVPNGNQISMNNTNEIGDICFLNGYPPTNPILLF
jgi:hypothetical protein